MQMFKTRNITAIAAFAFGVLSLQSHAATIFDNYSYTDIYGTASDDNTGGYADYASLTLSTGFLDSIDDINSVSMVDSYETAYAGSDAHINVDAYDYGYISGIYGYVSAGSDAFADTLYQDAYAYSDTVVDVDFFLETSSIYSFYNRSMGATGYANFYYELYSYDLDNIIFSGNLIEMDETDFWLSGSISNGAYNLIVEAITDADAASFGYDYGYASGDFELELTAVPVPAAVWLFGSGLLALAGFAPRKAG